MAINYSCSNSKQHVTTTFTLYSLSQKIQQLLSKLRLNLPLKCVQKIFHI